MRNAFIYHYTKYKFFTNVQVLETGTIWYQFYNVQNDMHVHEGGSCSVLSCRCFYHFRLIVTPKFTPNNAALLVPGLRMVNVFFKCILVLKNS